MRIARPIPRRALLRLLLLVAIVGGAVAAVLFSPLGGYLERERLAAALARIGHQPWAPAALVALYLLGCPLGLPTTPFLFAGAAVFGALEGAAYGYAGMLLGATVSWLLARRLGQDIVEHFAGRERLLRLERLLARRGFWSLVQIRLLPIPFPVVNFAAALAGVPLRTFVVTSAIGLLPAVVIYSWIYSRVAAALLTADASRAPALVRDLALALALALGLSILPQAIRGWRRRRRYRSLVAARRRAAGTASRTPGPPPPAGPPATGARRSPSPS